MEEAKKTQTITKADLVENVYRKVGFSKKESLDLVETVFETIKSTLEKGESVKISGFGKFEVRYKRTFLLPCRKLCSKFCKSAGINEGRKSAISSPKGFVTSINSSDDVLKN